jgi:hypothetical protein
MIGRLKSAKSEEAVEKLAQSVPDMPVEHQPTTKEKREEDPISDIISQIKQTLATTGDRDLDSQSKFFDWIGCHPGHSFYPVYLFALWNVA